MKTAKHALMAASEPDTHKILIPEDLPFEWESEEDSTISAP
jgi:hypothetical protein